MEYNIGYYEHKKSLIRNSATSLFPYWPFDSNSALYLHDGSEIHRQTIERGNNINYIMSFSLNTNRSGHIRKHLIIVLSDYCYIYPNWYLYLIFRTYNTLTMSTVLHPDTTQLSSAYSSSVMASGLNSQQSTRYHQHCLLQGVDFLEHVDSYDLNVYATSYVVKFSKCTNFYKLVVF